MTTRGRVMRQLLSKLLGSNPYRRQEPGVPALPQALGAALATARGRAPPYTPSAAKALLHRPLPNHAPVTAMAWCRAAWLAPQRKNAGT